MKTYSKNKSHLVDECKIDGNTTDVRGLNDNPAGEVEIKGNSIKDDNTSGKNGTSKSNTKSNPSPKIK